jgi:hypothetical protein
MGRRRKSKNLDSRPRAIVGGLLMFVIFGGIAVAAAAMLWHLTADSFRAASWAEVPATIVAAELRTVAPTGKSRTTTFEARAEYVYAWQGRELRSTRLTGSRFEGGSDNFGDWQKEIAGRMQAAKASGRPVTVYVNPDDPSEVMVDRSIRWVLVLLMGLFVLGFGCAGLAGLWLAASPPRPDSTGSAGKWAVAIAWNLFSLAMLAIAVTAKSWIGAAVILFFVAIGVLMLWGLVEELRQRPSFSSTARRTR